MSDADHIRILRTLLAKGYFPAELPPTFTTQDFGNRAVEIIESWRKDKLFKVEATKIKTSSGTKKTKRDAYAYKLTPTDSEFISKPKRGFERRNLQLTHPIPQALLYLEISRNWKTIQKWISKQKYSLDRLTLSDASPRGISDIDFSIHRAKKDFIDSCNDWILKTDITRFYPSIYTHSIAWAAYGKERVKSDMKLFEGTLADRIDVLVRACNKNQTIGIPIGPESSRIIAAIISARIDFDFFNNTKLDIDRADRLQDDWFIGTDSLDKAEYYLSNISRTYNEFGLEINGSKTSLNRMINVRNADWIDEISSFLYPKTNRLSGFNLRQLLDASLRLQQSFPTDPVMNYALSIIEGQRIGHNDVQRVESFLLKAAVISPTSMDRICRIILNLNFNTHEISVKRIASRFTELADRYIDNNYHFEIIWIFFTLRGLRARLNSKTMSTCLEKIKSSCISLILLDMERMGCCAHKLRKKIWEDIVTSEKVTNDGSWLLYYEGIRHGWLNDKKELMKHPFFAAMNSCNVKFYDENRNVYKSSTIISKRLIASRNSKIGVQKLLQRLRGLEEY